MRILSVELENVKSYARQRVEFSEGLNAVCGLNGSGKTTVVEAIGFALFDFLPYSQAEFVREGEKSGTVRVRLLLRDEREYEVVRRVGSGAQYFVVDAETGERQAERGPNVLEWVGTVALDIEGGVDLSALYKNAVGVPQGLITADFLQSSGVARKAIFDPLLRVEEYRNAFEYLRETTSQLNGRSGALEAEIGTLDEQIAPIPDQRVAVQEGELSLRDIDERLGRLTLARADIEGHMAELDALEREVRDARSEMDRARYDLQRFGDALESRQGDLERAEAAAQAVEESEQGYRLVVQARGALADLNRRKTERDRIESDLAVVTGNMGKVYGAIEQLAFHWSRAREAGEQAKHLEPEVQRQGDLDQALDRCRERLLERATLDREIRTLGADRDALTADLAGRVNRLAAAQAAREQATRRDGVRTELDGVRNELARIGAVQAERASVHQEGTRLRAERDRLSRESATLESVRVRIATLEAAPTDVEGLIATERRLRDERAHLTAAVDYQRQARLHLAEGHCPLLDLSCPAVSDNPGLLARLDVNLSVSTDRTDQIDANLAAVVRDQEVARSAATELNALRVESARMTQLAERRAEVETDLTRCRERYADLNGQISMESELITRRSSLELELVRLDAQADQAATAGELQSQIDADRARLHDLDSSLDRHQVLRDSLADLETEQDTVRRQLEALADPRGRQSRLLALAGEAPSLREQHDREQARLNDLNDRLEALTVDKMRYDGVVEAIAEQERVVAEHTPAHERYLQYREDAGRLEERRAQVGEAREKVREAQERCATLETELARLGGLYDAERHAGLRSEFTSVQADIEATGRERRLKGEEVDRLRRELERLLRLAERLEARRRELDELGRVATAIAFVRETLKTAGPVVTETLLTTISQTANELFAEIMDDHAAELRWTRDYEVVVQRGTEQRRFAQLSGGEQMSAALAVRLALLREMSNIRFAIFDEPTQNMDAERRSNLADQIQAVRGFDQLIVISHDDTFEHHTDNLIRLIKVNEETRLESA